QLPDGGVALRRRDHQRRHARVVRGVDVGAAGDQFLDVGGLPVEHRVGEGRRLRRLHGKREQHRESRGGHTRNHGGGRTIAYGTLSRLPQLRMNVDHRFTQTQKRYAADDLETMSEARNYQAHVFGLVRPYVGSHVLEVGCGIGTMTMQLLDHAQRVVCIEPNLNCATRAREALAGSDRVTIRIAHLEECPRDDLQQQKFDTVVCVNVLEHIEDDVRALALFKDVVAGTAGQVLVFVPAIQALYSQHDAALGHHRRYSKRSLRDAFA